MSTVISVGYGCMLFASGMECLVLFVSAQCFYVIVCGFIPVPCRDSENHQSLFPGVTVCACMRFAGVIRSGYLVLANQHTSSEGQGSRDLRQTRVEPY